MTGSVPRSPGALSWKGQPVELLEYLLQMMATQVRAHLACVYAFNRVLNRWERIANVRQGYDEPEGGEPLANLLQSHLTELAANVQPRFLNGDMLAPYRLGAGLLVPLAASGETMGVLGLFATAPQTYDAQHLAQLAPLNNLATTVLEKHHLAARLTTAQSILVAAQAMAENPSPQQVLHVLHDHVFGPHITTSAILLYGPIREDHPNQFDYLEVQGTWSKRRGSGFGLGMKFYLNDYPELLEHLSERKLMSFTHFTAVEAGFDPLVRSLLQAERVRSLTLLALNAAQRKLGVILLACDKTHLFTPQELGSYQTVSEFLAIHSMSHVLQQQNVLVQQGRAALLDAVTDGVVMVLPDVAGARVLTVNQRFTRLFNVPESAAQGLSLTQLLEEMEIPETVRHELRQTWESAPVRDILIQSGEFHMVHSAGLHADIQWYSAPVYQSNRVLGRIYTFHDVTAERAATRINATFLSRVSHELRTPLTSISGFAEFILEEIGDDLPDLAREYTEIILSSARHLNRVFNDMIDITRADAGELRLNLSNVHLPDVIIEVVARLELHYKQRGQTVLMELDDDLPPVWADADRVAQVLTNLVHNAIKYSPDGSTIRINTQYISAFRYLPESAPGEVLTPCILVSVSDEGPGLKQDEVEKVFRPFYRTDSARQQKIEGAGLGLAVSRSIIELHRGKIWAVPSQPGQGGCFLFTLATVKRT